MATQHGIRSWKGGALGLLIPPFASAQGVKLVYRHELHGMVAVPQTPAALKPRAERVKAAPTPARVIAMHETMIRGYRANANDRGAMTVAIAHCERQIARAIREISRLQ